MASFAGQTVGLTFHVVSNTSLPTIFRVDDAALQQPLAFWRTAAEEAVRRFAASNPISAGQARRPTRLGRILNSFTTGRQFFPSVASDVAGNFVVVWSSYGQDGDSYGIFGQRYDSAGIAQGDEFRVNSYTPNHWIPSVASDASGKFVVVWSSAHDGSYIGVFGQRYDNAGDALGSEFQVNSFTFSGQYSPAVASDASGNLVVVWHSFGQDGSIDGIFGQRYDSAGGAQGDEFQVNSFTTSSQRFTSVAATGTDKFVVSWESFSQDGSGWGIFGQRLHFPVTVTAPNGGERLSQARRT